MSAALLASVIMAGSAQAAPLVYDDNAIVTPGTTHDDSVILRGGATLSPGLAGGSLEAEGGYQLEQGTVDHVSLNDSQVPTAAPADLTKSTFESVTLIGDHGYTGATTINAGTLYLGDGEQNARLLGTTSVEVKVGGRLVINVGDNTFSLDHVPSFTVDGGLSVNNTAGQTTILENINASGGGDSTFSVGSHSGGGTTILVDSHISVNRHTITGGTEIIDAGSSILANEISLQDGVYDGTPTLDVDGGYIANQDDTGRSEIRIINGTGAEINIHNDATVRGNITADHPTVTDVSVNITDGGLLDGSVDLLHGTLTVSEGEVIGGWQSRLEVGTGDVLITDSSNIDTRVISVENGNLTVQQNSTASARRNVHVGNGNLTVAGSTLSAGRDVRVDEGEINILGGTASAGRDIRIGKGDLVGSGSATAGRDIRLGEGDLKIDASAGRDILLTKGDIDVRNMATVSAGRNITLTEGNIEVWNQSTLSAGRNVTLTDGSLTTRNDSSVSIGRNLVLSSAGGVATDVDVSGGGTFDVGRNIIIETGDLKLGSNTTVGRNIRIGTGNIDVFGRTVDVGRNIQINNGDITALHSDISVGRNITLWNGGIDLENSNLLAGQNGFGRVTVYDGDVVLSNSFMEADRFTYNGWGWVDVVNESTIQARTTINDGSLYVSETSSIVGRTTIGENAHAWIEGIIDGNVRLTGGSGFATGGVLAGSQVTITGNLSNNGSIAPGLPLDIVGGEVLVGGNFNQRSNGTVALGIYDNNIFDRITVDGTANINGGYLYLEQFGYKPQRDDTLALITAAGGVNLIDSYSVEHNFATDTMLSPEIRYTDDAVELFFEQLSFVGQGKTPNQRAIARALDKAASRGQLDSLFDHLNYTSRKNISRLLQRLSPEGLTAIFNAGFATAQTQNINIERRLDDVRAGSRGFSANGLALSNNRGTINFDGAPIINERDGLSLAGFDGKSIVTKEVVAPIVEESPWGFFVTGSGEWADIETTSHATGGDFASGGVTIGADYRVNDNFVVGLYGGYVHTKTDMANGGDIKANGGRLGVYGSYFNDGFYVNALASGGYNHYKINRDTIGGTARGKTDGGQFDTLLGAGYDFSLGCVTLGPVGSLQYSYVGFDKFSERGSNARLNVSKNSQDSLRTLLGAKLATSWNVGGMTLRPEVRAQWKHEYLDREGAIDSSFTGSGALFTVHGPKVGRDSLVVDAGASLDVSETLSVYAYYTGELARQNYSSNSVNGGFRISF